MNNYDIFKPLIDLGYTTRSADGGTYYDAPSGYGPGMSLFVNSDAHVFENVDGYSNKFDYFLGNALKEDPPVVATIQSLVNTITYDNEHGGVDPDDFNDFMDSVTQ